MVSLGLEGTQMYPPPELKSVNTSIASKDKSGVGASR
jgi:hypothetical protein